MKKGIIEFATLLVISKGEVYVSDIINTLKLANLITVEGTLYPLLSRLSSAGLVSHRWEESTGGPPRKYYSLTEKGKTLLNEYNREWENISQSINLLKL